MFRAGARVLVALLLPVAAVASGRAVPLAEAVKHRDLDAVRALLQQRVDVNASEPDGSTALHWAAHQGDADAVDLLLRAGASADAANRYGATPLALAAANGNATVVGRLLEGGADPGTAWPGGETVLMTAARAGRLDAVRVLLAHQGTAPSRSGRQGTAPSRSGRQGTAPSRSGRQGTAPSRSGRQGADVNAREATRGQTALMWAAAEGHADVIRALVGAGADMRAVSHGPSGVKDPDKVAKSSNSRYERRPVPRLDRFTSLQFAVHAGQIEAARALIDLGASLADETPEGMGLVTLAIANAHYELAAVLAEKGADVNAAKVGFAPLHQLVRVRTLNIGQFFPPVPTGRLTAPELANVLIQHGADVDARTTKGFPDGHRFAFGLNATPFLLAAKGGDVPMMQVLAEHGSDVRAVNANGTNAIMAAAGVEMFNPNEDSGTDADGLAALKLAVELGAGDINAANKDGNTALHGAVFRTTTDAIKFLVETGARLDVKNKPKCVYSAGCSGQNPEGYTPYGLAVGGLGMLGSYRPEAAALLRELMIARGLTPEAKEDKDKYSFGVTVK
jgi:ankyrin repeat protein